MRSADGDDHARLTNFQTAGAMHDADVGDVETFVGFACQPAQFAHGHWRVRFVDQVQRAATAGPLARITVERYGRAAFGQDDSSGDSADVDPLSRQFKEVVSSS